MVHLVLQVKVIIELRKQVTDLTTQLTDVKKELTTKKKALTTLTTERDALKAKKTPAVASATEVKELAKLRVAAIEASAREKLLLQQIQQLQDRLQENSGARATQASANATADAVAIAGAMKPDYSGLASLLQAAAAPAAASARQARGGEDHSAATNAAQSADPASSITFHSLGKLKELGLLRPL